MCTSYMEETLAFGGLHKRATYPQYIYCIMKVIILSIIIPNVLTYFINICLSLINQMTYDDFHGAHF